MRFYLVILSEAITYDNDVKFGKYVMDSNFEYWRYTTYNWILCTPKTVSTNQILTNLVQAYGPIFTTVLEITINDFACLLPDYGNDPVDAAPIKWFKEVTSKEFIPKWEKLKD